MKIYVAAVEALKKKWRRSRKRNEGMYNFSSAEQPISA